MEDIVIVSSSVRQFIVTFVVSIVVSAYRGIRLITRHAFIGVSPCCFCIATSFSVLLQQQHISRDQQQGARVIRRPLASSI
jgi:hypothetical protein